MPRIQRRIRLRQRDDFATWSTKWQVLMHGGEILENGPGFDDAEAERRGWIEHRDELLKACEPGKRPAAFYEFDLALTGRVIHKLHDQLNTLMDHDLIGAEEAVRVDNTHGVFNPRQSREFCQAFENEVMIHAQHLGEHVLRSMAYEFSVASRFHTWRGRPDLADRYALRAATTRRCADAAR